MTSLIMTTRFLSNIYFCQLNSWQRWWIQAQWLLFTRFLRCLDGWVLCVNPQKRPPDVRAPGCISSPKAPDVRGPGCISSPKAPDVPLLPRPPYVRAPGCISAPKAPDVSLPRRPRMSGPPDISLLPRPRMSLFSLPPSSPDVLSKSPPFSFLNVFLTQRSQKYVYECKEWRGFGVSQAFPAKVFIFNFVMLAQKLVCVGVGVVFHCTHPFSYE